MLGTYLVHEPGKGRDENRSSIFLRTLIRKAPRDDFFGSHQFGKDGMLRFGGMSGEALGEKKKKTNLVMLSFI